MPDFGAQRAEEIAEAIATVISENVVTNPVDDDRHQDQAKEKQTHKQGAFFEGKVLQGILIQCDRLCLANKRYRCPQPVKDQAFAISVPAIRCVGLFFTAMSMTSPVHEDSKVQACCREQQVVWQYPEPLTDVSGCE